MKYYPDVVAHHGKAHSVRGRGNEDVLDKSVSVAYKMSGIAQQAYPVVKPFPGEL